MRGIPKKIATKQDLAHLCTDLSPDAAKKALSGLGASELSRLKINQTELAGLKKTVADRKRKQTKKSNRLRVARMNLRQKEEEAFNLKLGIQEKSQVIRENTIHLRELGDEIKALRAALDNREV